jgi:hypothetical protein
MATLEASVSKAVSGQRDDFMLSKDMYLSPQIAKLE